MTVAPYKVSGTNGVHRAISIRERSDLWKGGVHSKFSTGHDSRGKGPRDGGLKGLRIRKGVDFQPTFRIPIADWVQSTSDRIQVDIDAIRNSSDQENAMEEDGRESDSPHASRISHSRTGVSVLDGNRQGGSGVPFL
ncbi:hypothetical protein V6N12_000794 [Hibiscus sabdariffa]|uniref:Uncharacterized protein n=1 Tax=Hibiscus sabdariffa TaxID=183260 RepID=A0ABR2BXG1_9ROSI